MSEIYTPGLLWCRKNNSHAQYILLSVECNTVYYKVPDNKRTLQMPLKEWQDVMIRVIPEDFQIY